MYVLWSLYNNAVHPVICEGWHFTHKWKHLRDRIISTKGEVWAQNPNLTPPHVIEVAVLSQESERKCATGIEIASSFEFSIGFLKCFVVYFLFFMVMGFDLVGSFKLRKMVTWLRYKDVFYMYI
jgi:hypothetical protein